MTLVQVSLDVPGWPEVIRRLSFRRRARYRSVSVPSVLLTKLFAKKTGWLRDARRIQDRSLSERILFDVCV